MYLECILTVSYYPCSCSGATTVVASISRAYTEGMRQALCTLRLRGEHLGRGNLPAPQIHEQSSSSIAPLASSCLCNSSTCTRPGSFRPSAAAGPTQRKHPDPAWGRPRRKPAFAVARSQPPAQARTCRRARSVRGSQTGPRVSGLACCAAAEGSRYLTESSPGESNASKRSSSDKCCAEKVWVQGGAQGCVSQTWLRTVSAWVTIFQPFPSKDD